MIGLGPMPVVGNLEQKRDHMDGHSHPGSEGAEPQTGCPSPGLGDTSLPHGDWENGENREKGWEA